MEPYLKERTEEGDVWQIGSIQIGGLFALAGGGYGLYEATAALGFTAPTAALRTYLSEYSVVEGRWVDFNDSGPLVGSGQLSMTYTVDGQITAPTAEDGVFGLNRNIGVYVVTAVPEPSTYAMALAGLACGGYSMFRRRKRA